jgi:selenocysteine-specific elongation factor
VFAGNVSVGDAVMISPSGLRAKVRSLHVQNGAAVRATGGDRCALNLTGAGVAKDAIQRGDWVVAEPLHAPTDRVDAQLTVLADAPSDIRHWTPVHVHVGAADLPGRVAPLEGRTIARGAAGLAQLVLDRPGCALKGDRFVIRDQSAKRTLGGGVILDPFPPRRGRRHPARLALLRDFSAAAPADALRLLAALVPSGADLSAFERAWNVAGADAQTLRRDPRLRIVARGAHAAVFCAERWSGRRNELLDQLAAFHAACPDRRGAAVADLRSAARDLPPEAIRALLEELLQSGAVVARDGLFALPKHAAQVPAPARKLWERAAPLFLDAGYLPLRPDELSIRLGAAAGEIEAMLRHAVQDGLLYRISRTHYLAASAVESLAGVIATLAEPGSAQRFSVSDFRARTGIGRNHTIAILEFFDRVGLTMRSGDGRMVRPRPALTGAVRGSEAEACP